MGLGDKFANSEVAEVLINLKTQENQGELAKLLFGLPRLTISGYVRFYHTSLINRDM